MAVTRRSIGRRIATCLTAVFMGVASTLPLSAANDVCAQTLTAENVEPLTGYTDHEDVVLASAYVRFMREQARDPAVLQAILEASEQTGIDFELMVVKAVIESQLGLYDKPLHIRGEARGLYQFLPSTWMTLFSWFGAQYQDGKYRELAEAVEFQGQIPLVKDKAMREQLLALRSDHEVASFIKAMQIKNEEQPFLKDMLGREPNATDYYIVHFLGIPRAKTFYRNLEKSPDRAAAPVMKREARYNRFVFYEKRKPLSFKKVYERLDRIMGNRLEDIRTASKQILEGEQCTPALRRGVVLPFPSPGQQMERVVTEPEAQQPELPSEPEPEIAVRPETEIEETQTLPETEPAPEPSPEPEQAPEPQQQILPPPQAAPGF